MCWNESRPVCGWWLAGQSIEQTICLQAPQHRHPEHQSGGGTEDWGSRAPAASATNHGQRSVGAIVARVTGPNCAKLAAATAAAETAAATAAAAAATLPTTATKMAATTGHKSTATGTGATLFCLWKRRGSTTSNIGRVQWRQCATWTTRPATAPTAKANSDGTTIWRSRAKSR